MPELAVESLGIYEDMAVRLANNPKELQTIKQKLIVQRNTCPLFDTARFVENLEQAYYQMWQIYQSNEMPRVITLKQLL
jgi:protein O-GlcNAc transferase